MKMKLVTAAAAVALLAGCAADFDTKEVAAIAPKGDAFTQALQKHYIERAEFEVGETDWRSVSFFNTRARMAAEGKVPALQQPADRNLKANAEEIGANYTKLAAALSTNAPANNPDACALAQTWFEHWLEQQEEGHQPKDIAEARTGFMNAMPKCQPVAVVAAAPKIVKTFAVYFDTSKAVITADANKVLAEVAKAQAEIKPANVFLSGHTDTVGNAKANQALSAKRAAAVGDALAKLGVKSSMLDVKAHGEDHLAVATADNTKEAKNRRVEIHFEK